MKTRKNEAGSEYENFGIQMRRDVRRMLNVKAAQLDIQIREALEQAVMCWTSASCCATVGASRAELQDKVMDWIAHPANETERGLADIVVRLANSRG